MSKVRGTARIIADVEVETKIKLKELSVRLDKPMGKILELLIISEYAKGDKK